MKIKTYTFAFVKHTKARSLMELHPIAHFHSPFTSKFGIPRQSGLVPSLEGTVVFTSDYRNADYLRGIEAFDYLWLLWEFSANPHACTSPVVRPPRLGGNKRVGVFASRSPFRPNPVGISCVRLIGIDWETPKGPVLHIGGADLMDGTPIFDIKPYVVYADSHPEARSGFVDDNAYETLRVEIPTEVAALFSPTALAALRQTLEQDPRPHYQNDSGKQYAMPFYDYDIRFAVEEKVLRVTEARPLTQKKITT